MNIIYYIHEAPKRIQSRERETKTDSDFMSGESIPTKFQTKIKTFFTIKMNVFDFYSTY